MASLAIPAAAEAGKPRVKLGLPSAGDIAIAKLKLTAKAKPGKRIPRKPAVRLKIRGEKSKGRSTGERRTPLPDSLTAVVRKRIVKRTARKVKIELYTVLVNAPVAGASANRKAQPAGSLDLGDADLQAELANEKVDERFKLENEWKNMLEKRQQSCGKGLKKLPKAPKKTGSLLDGNPSLGAARAAFDWALFDACPAAADVEDFEATWSHAPTGSKFEGLSFICVYVRGGIVRKQEVEALIERGGNITRKAGRTDGAGRATFTFVISEPGPYTVTVRYRQKNGKFADLDGSLTVAAPPTNGPAAPPGFDGCPPPDTPLPPPG